MATRRVTVPAARDRLEELSGQECLQLLRSSELGRVAVVGPDQQPLIFPVNYVFDEGVVVFRTAPGTKLRLAPLRPACFEIDGWDWATGVGWSVVVTGIAHDITNVPAGDHAPAERLRRLQVRPGAPGAKDNWIGIWANAITGRKFRGTPVSLR